jgi:hypothetical protein
MMIDFYMDNREAKHALLNTIWVNKDKVNFTFFKVEFRKKCKITLNLGKYIVRAEVPLIMSDSYVMFRLYKRKLFGLYESYLGCVAVGSPYADSLEACVNNYIDAKVTELRKSIDEAEEAAQRKVNAEFIGYLKDNCSTSD